MTPPLSCERHEKLEACLVAEAHLRKLLSLFLLFLVLVVADVVALLPDLILFAEEILTWLTSAHSRPNGACLLVLEICSWKTSLGMCLELFSFFF